MTARALLALSLLALSSPASATFAVPSEGSALLLEAGTPSLALGFAMGQGPLQPRMGLRYDLGVNVVRGVGAIALRAFDAGLIRGDLHAELGPLLAMAGLPAAGVVGGTALLFTLHLDPVLVQLGPRLELGTVLEADDRWDVKAGALLDVAVGLQSPRAGLWLFAEPGYVVTARSRGATSLRAGLALRVPIDL